MQYYELATLILPVGETRGDVLAAIMADIRAALAGDPAAGTLLGSWVPEFGPQNRVALLRGFESRSALEDARETTLMSSDPFGCGTHLDRISLESYAQFPGLPAVVPAEYGTVYEFRTYRLKIGGLAPTLAAWEKGIPPRIALSPLVTVMYALDGPPRFTHVWVYRSFEERLSIRAHAFASGAWPAPGAPEWLTTDMITEIYIPTACSPLK